MERYPEYIVKEKKFIATYFSMHLHMCIWLQFCLVGVTLYALLGNLPFLLCVLRVGTCRHPSLFLPVILFLVWSHRSLFNHFHIDEYLGHLQLSDISNKTVTNTLEQACEFSNFPGSALLSQKVHAFLYLVNTNKWLFSKLYCLCSNTTQVCTFPHILKQHFKFVPIRWVKRNLHFKLHFHD